MSDEKISAMPAAGALTGAELVPVVQGGGNVKATTQNIANLAPAPSVPAGANPTATAGPAAVNGAAATFLRSDGAPAIQLGTNAVLGLAKGDGITTNLVAGVASVITNPLVVTGINFGVTTLANYQEANWTPLDQSGGGLTLTNLKTVFTRIGRLVICTFSFTFPANADTNPVTIGGVPLGGPPANEYVIGTFVALNTPFFGFSYVAPSTSQMLMLSTAGALLTNANLSSQQVAGQFIITK